MKKNLIFFLLMSCMEQPKKEVNSNMVDIRKEKNEFFEDKSNDSNLDHTIISSIDTLAVDTLPPAQDPLANPYRERKHKYTQLENDAYLNKINELVELGFEDKLTDLRESSDGYIYDLSFPITVKNDDFDVEININNIRIPVEKVNVEYLSGEELSKSDAKFTNLKNGHLVVFGCKFGKDCLYNEKNQEYSLAILQPMKNKEECQKLIKIFNDIKNIINR